MKAKNLYEIVWTSRPLMQASEAAVEAGLIGTGLTVRMRAVLEMLHIHGDLTVPDLASKLDIKRQYVQLMVNETLSAGLAEQQPNPRHKRSSLIALTEKGKTLITDVISSEMDLMADFSDRFDEDEIETALKVVRAVLENLKSHTRNEFL